MTVFAVQGKKRRRESFSSSASGPRSWGKGGQECQLPKLNVAPVHVRDPDPDGLGIGRIRVGGADTRRIWCMLCSWVS